MARLRSGWTQTKIAQTKAAVKADADRVLAEEGPRRRTQWFLGEIRNLRDGGTAQSQLRCFVCAVSLLVHHHRFGGLSLRQAQDLTSLAYALLQIQGISPHDSPLAFLYAELHLALSQVYRREGLHWMSAWEQQLAFYLGGAAAAKNPGLENLSLGIRTLRLGHGGLALSALAKAQLSGLGERSIARAKIDFARALRFVGLRKEAQDFNAECLSLPWLTPEEKKEFEWETWCAETMKTGQVSSLIHAVRRGRSHHQWEYLVEAYLWTRAVSSKRWLLQFPTIGSLARDPALDIPKKSLLYKAAQAITRCYDYQVPFLFRLRRLEKILPKLPQLLTIDQELLVWAAVARWLVRSRNLQLAALVLAEYRALSLRLSNAKNGDALGVLSDLLEREWFQDMERLPTQKRSA